MWFTLFLVTGGIGLFIALPFILCSAGAQALIPREKGPYFNGQVVVLERGGKVYVWDFKMGSGDVYVGRIDNRPGWLPWRSGLRYDQIPESVRGIWEFLAPIRIGVGQRVPVPAILGTWTPAAA